ncbi:MAG TPA: formimidoylglutamase [Rhodothermales bacterium]|nr:formimidoylglutamase [Rhodothermales bacterium]
MLIPPTTEPPLTQPDDHRIGHLLGMSEEAPSVVIIGFPSDQGVLLNGGRPGAAAGPDAIRRAFYAMTPGAAGAHGLFLKVKDLGNVQVTGDVVADLEALAEVVSAYLGPETIVAILGGGHETAYGHFLGYVSNDVAPRIVNWDAHADVRPPRGDTPTSGSSFYLALEHKTHPTPDYTVVGLLPHAVAPAHVDYLHEHPGRHLWREDIDGDAIDDVYACCTDPTMVSFDLDAVDQAYAPGVSAPAAGGLDPARWLHGAYAAGVSPAVWSIDICELNPVYDRDNQTARLAALTLWHFLSGCAARHVRRDDPTSPLGFG